MLTDEQRADGWIEHDGGAMPVSRLTLIRVAIRTAHGVDCDPHGVVTAEGYHWNISPSKPGAIIAYRPETPA